MTETLPGRTEHSDLLSATPLAQRWAWVCGAVGGVVGMAVADLTAWLIAPSGAPVPAVGTMIINLLPAGLVNWGKETLGTADKPVLLVLIVLGVLALCALAGRLELRRPYGGGLVFAGVAAVGLIAALAGGQTSVRAVVPTVFGLLCGYVVLRALIARLQRLRTVAATAEPDQVAVAMARRTFLIWTGVAALAATAGAVAGRALVATAGAVEEARSQLRLPPATGSAPIPAEAELGIDGLAPYLTPNADFYRIDTALQVPTIAVEDWSLTVTGQVDREMTISFADLIARPMVEHVATLACVSNEVGGDLVGNAVWLGYPIRDLLAEAGIRPGMDMVLSTSDDGWTAGTPLAALTDPDRMALLAVGMNGEPLPLEHGYPVRMVVPGLYGYVSATKWVRELKVTTFAEDRGYWTPLGWSALGPIKTASRIDVPRKRSLDAGQVVVAGVAWDQHTGIAKVEVAIDGDWREAELAQVTGPDTWRQWVYRWDALPGQHTVAVRATNADGQVQTEDQAPPGPDGATGWHTITVDVG